MIDAKHFDLVKRHHGAHGSWAVWAPPTAAPKSNVGDLAILDPAANPQLLATLNPAVVMVGLNISRSFSEEPFRNFHDPRPVANDFKIRFAFFGTSFWGAYMTDFIKGLVEPASGRLVDYVADHPEVLRHQLEVFRAELTDLGRPRPLLLAFGHAVHRLLAKHLPRGDYSDLIALTHYSHRVSKERYREIITAQTQQTRLATA